MKEEENGTRYYTMHDFLCVCVLGMTTIAGEREAVGWMIIDENSDGTRKGKEGGDITGTPSRLMRHYPEQSCV